MRLIDADELKRCFKSNTFRGNRFCEAFDAYVDAAPTIEPQKWILISEAEPGAEHVLATLRWDEDDYEVTEMDYHGIEAAQDDEDYLISDRAKGIIEHVVAWMPLPEPWRGAE